MNSTNKNTEKFIVDTPATLIEFISVKRQGISRSNAKKLIVNGLVSVNGRMVTQTNFELKEGSKVEIGKSTGNERFIDRRIHIVFEDEHLIVVDKHCGLLSNSVSPKETTVQSLLNNYLEHTHQRCHAHIVHRLDRDTSGLLLFAKSKEVAFMFEDGWKERVYDRRYIAMLHGFPPQDEGTIQSWLKDDNKFVTHSSPVDNGGKFAETHYKVIDRGENYCLVELRLETGRKNQIRVHMQDLGCPVAGDKKYGDGFNPIDRLALHAYRLCFVHPVTGKDYKFESEAPASFRNLQ